MNKYWFKPKRFGIGAYPVTWEGWAVVGLFLLYIFYLVQNVDESQMFSYFFNLAIGIIILIIIRYKKTDGKWKWHWGN